MNDLQSKLSTLEAQLAAAKAELEAAKTKASQTDVLSEKLSYLTRARAAQDLISSIEQEISTVRGAIAEAERQAHRQELLEQCRAIAREVEQHQGELQKLLDGVAKAVAALQRQAPGIIHRWRQAREKWVTLFAVLEPGGWPTFGGDIENSKRLDALQRVLSEVGEEARALVALPPGFTPSNRLEYPSHEGKNWHAVPPESPGDFAALILDTLLSRPFAAQPQPVLAPEPSRSL